MQRYSDQVGGKAMKSLIKRFIKNQSGATAIEYGLIAAGLAVIIVAIFGTTTGPVYMLMDTLFSNVAESVGTATPST
jgi:pilus assembly protein Flp/PilA